jgi:hypothetical protein
MEGWTEEEIRNKNLRAPYLFEMHGALPLW